MKRPVKNRHSQKSKDFCLDDILVQSAVKELVDDFMSSTAREECEGLIMIAVQNGEVVLFHTDLTSIELLGSLDIARSIEFERIADE